MNIGVNKSSAIDVRAAKMHLGRSSRAGEICGGLGAKLQFKWRQLICANTPLYGLAPVALARSAMRAGSVSAWLMRDSDRLKRPSS